MDKVKQPSNQEVRDWLARRQDEHKPPPDPKEVRRQLGWGLLKEEDPSDCSR